MKTLLKIIIIIILIALCAYLEDYTFRGAGMFVGIALACFGFLIGESGKDWHDFFTLLGASLYFAFFLFMAIGIHLEKTEEGVNVRSPFFTHVIEHGQRVEDMDLKSHYTQYYSRVEVKIEPFYFLHDGKGSCSIYSSHLKIMTIPDHFSIIEQDFGHGALNAIRLCDSVVYDMRAKKITVDYDPEVIDITPDYTASPLN